MSDLIAKKLKDIDCVLGIISFILLLLVIGTWDNGNSHCEKCCPHSEENPR